MIHHDDDEVDILKRRARRFARKGDYRKAALALRERAALIGDAPSFVVLGDMLRRARRVAEALDALKQGMYLHRRCGSQRRARTVARMIVALDPWGTRPPEFRYAEAS